MSESKEIFPTDFYHINRSRDLANHIHGNQFRKGRHDEIGPDYLVHPAMVVHQLWKWGFNPKAHAELFCLAWLHDVVEESGTKVLEDIRTIDPQLETWVKELTYLPGQDFCPYQTKRQYISSFLDKEKTSVQSLIVKIADRICNIRDFMETDRFVDYYLKYAPKYCEKGKAIIAAVLGNRRQEIKDYMGTKDYWYPIMAGDISEVVFRVGNNES